MQRSSHAHALQTYALTVSLIISCTAAVLLCLERGIWLDEAYSYWFARHDLTFTEALKTRWMHDGHPPLYPAYAWLFEPLFGSSISTFRYINFGVLVFVMATGWLVWARCSDRYFFLLFAALTAANPFTILYAAEFRSYFIQLVLSACLIAQMRLADDHGPFQGTLWVLIGVTAILLINLHYVDSLVTFIFLGVWALSLSLQRRWCQAIGIVAVAAAGAVLLAISLVAFLYSSTPIPANYTSTAQALFVITAPMGAGLIANLPACAGAAIAIRKMPRRVALHGYAGRLFVASCITAVVFLAYNVVLHNLVMRYLIASIPLSIALLAHFVSSSSRVRSKATLPICVMAITVTVATSVYGLVNKRWETSVPVIKAAIARCRGTEVVAVNPLSFKASNDPLITSIGTRPAMSLAYELVARKNGFPVSVAYQGEPRRVLRRPCPTLVWLEHRYIANVSDSDLIQTSGLFSPTAQISSRRLVVSPERLVLEVVESPRHRMQETNQDVQPGP